MKDASNHAYLYNLEGTKTGEIKFPTIGSVSGFSGDKNDNEAFYVFTSYTFPPTIYKLDVASNKSEVFRKTEVAFHPEDFVSEQIFYTSKDGTRVPMTITYKKGMKKNGSNPVMLYGYGGFNISMIRWISFSTCFLKTIRISRMTTDTSSSKTDGMNGPSILQGNTVTNEQYTTNKNVANKCQR